MRRVLVLFALAVVDLVIAGPWRAFAQHSSPAAGHDDGHAVGPSSPSPDAPGFDPTAAIRALSP